MLTHLFVENFKSIRSLELTPGRVNVLIGENGCGKSNILEAMAMAGGAESDRLSNEFLTSRGIRVTSPQFMRSAFDGNEPYKINLKYVLDQQYKVNFQLENDNQPYSKWTTNPRHFPDKPLRFQLGTFLIYSPENSALRNFYQEGQIEPLGINGEGLLKLLKVIQEQNPEKLEIINQALQLFGWYDSIDIPKDFNAQEDKIQIRDRHVAAPFDQRSANEGFLFVLFYMALMVSEVTPKIFAVDNIDASLNPKLCCKLIHIIAELAKQFDKQVFLTTHNPAILDGLDLTDGEQKLFVVSRNRQGCTRVKTIGPDQLPVSSDDEPLKLSEAMLRGYIGGLPKGF